MKVCLFVLLCLFAHLCPAHSDVLIATRQRTWDPVTAVDKAFVTQSFEDRGLDIVVTDPHGKRVQIKRGFVVATYALPDPKLPTEAIEGYELDELTKIKSTIEKLSEVSPKIKAALLPYQTKFDAIVQPELDKFAAGFVKVDGNWIERTQHEANLAAIAEAKRREQEKEEARQRVIQEENAKKAIRKEQERLAAMRLEELARKEREAALAKEAEEKRLANEQAAKASEQGSNSGSGTLNGYAWRAMSTKQRISLCNIYAAQFRSRKPGVTGQLLFDSLEAFYSGSNPDILRQPVKDIAAATAILAE